MTGTHPYWCTPGACSAIGATGAHRSMPAVVDGVAVNLIADATTPDAARVEFRGGPGTLAPGTAVSVGRLLVWLGRAASG
jgi:hypothetical protein